MPVKDLKKFLDQEKVKYVTISHSAAFTAQEIAARAHVSGNELAKTVMVRLDGRLAMAVLRAPDKVDLDALKAAAGAGSVELATEEEFGSLFPQCELGAMPPFGNLYGIDVYVDERLAADEEIAFNAGSFTELVRMAYRDFERLVHPRAAELAG